MEKLKWKTTGIDLDRGVFFRIPGSAQPKERPRVNKKTGVVYTPKATKLYEQRVTTYATQQGAKQRKYPGHVSLSVSIWFYWPDKRRRDADNAAKAVLDALNGLAYVDDAQIERLVVQKCLDGDDPRTEVYIEELADVRAE